VAQQVIDLDPSGIESQGARASWRASQNLQRQTAPWPETSEDLRDTGCWPAMFRAARSAGTAL
jgi:hypothetical protein